MLFGLLYIITYINLQVLLSILRIYQPKYSREYYYKNDLYIYLCNINFSKFYNIYFLIINIHNLTHEFLQLSP